MLVEKIIVHIPNNMVIPYTNKIKRNDSLTSTIFLKFQIEKVALK